MRKTVIIMLTICLPALLLSACGGAGNPAEPAQGEEIVIQAEEEAEAASPAGESTPVVEPAAAEPEKPAREDWEAYLALLQQQREQINAYSWQKGYYGYGTQTEEQIPRPVAFSDVYGDETPEMIYVSLDPSIPGGVCTKLNIVTSENGRVRSLYTRNWDVMAGGGFYYALFRLQGEERLYAYTSTGDESWTTGYCCFESSGEELTLAYLLEHSVHPDYTAQTYGNAVHEYTRSGQEIPEGEYESAVRELESRTCEVLMLSKNGGDFAQAYAAENGCPAMTCDEAIAWLQGMIGSAAPGEAAPAAVPAWSAAYREIVLQKVFLSSGDPDRGYGDLENGPAVITFALHDLNGDGIPELLIFNGFNGRDLRANYVFSFDGTNVVYCGFAPADCYGVQGVPGLFSRVTSSGFYLEDQYAGVYSEVSYLDAVGMSDFFVTRERIQVLGTAVGSGETVEIFRTDNAALLNASRGEPCYDRTMTWQELNQQGWEALAAPFYG